MGLGVSGFRKFRALGFRASLLGLRTTSAEQHGQCTRTSAAKTAGPFGMKPPEVVPNVGS